MGNTRPVFGGLREKAVEVSEIVLRDPILNEFAGAAHGDDRAIAVAEHPYDACACKPAAASTLAMLLHERGQHAVKRFLQSNHFASRWLRWVIAAREATFKDFGYMLG